jgi:TPR repeat protein
MNAKNDEHLFLEANLAYEADSVDEAEKILLELVNSVHVESHQLLGFIYRTEPPKIDINKSKYFYEKYFQLLNDLAQAEDGAAMLTLGKAYQYGDNIEIDQGLALSLILRAAELGNRDAGFHLSNLYRYGWCGAAESQKLSLKWLIFASRKKHPEALYTLGLAMKNNGDSEKGMQLIKESENFGFFVAKNYLKEYE